ncbi:ribonuclease H-like domain-containing protein [Candidatus Wolfebacteria bacterium]|nr:ribonuclease H-like domain-containing protein [Candidatus Wolfebacteria bacterium]
MNYIVFDIETTDTLPYLNEKTVPTLDIAILGAYNSKTKKYTSYTAEELVNFWPLIEETDALIGFNSDTFDIPLLNKYYPGDLTDMKSIDLLSDVYKSLGRRIRLNNLAEATLGEGKSSHGLIAIEWWQKGEVDKVRDYCLQDVKITKDLFEYAKKHGIIKWKDLTDIKDIKIDTSAWEITDGGSVTQTLGL